MYVQLDCLTVGCDSTELQQVTAFLTAHGVQIVDELVKVDAVPEALARCPEVPLVIVNLDPNPHQTLATVGQLCQKHPRASFMVFSHVVDATLLMDAMHLGVREFMPLPLDEEKLAASMERLAQFHGLGRKGRLINIIPSTGGCGATTIACNLAAALAKAGRTALVDLNFAHGAAATAFDLRPRYTIHDVLTTAEKPDRRLVENALAVHGDSHVAVLGRSERFVDPGSIEPAKMAALLAVLERDFDHLVLDSALSIGGLYEVILRRAHLNVLIVQQSVNSVRQAERFLTGLRRMGVESATLRIIVSRFAKKGAAVEPQEIERALGRSIDFTIPNDYRNTLDAMNYGHPLLLWRPRLEISQRLGELAQTLTTEQRQQQAQRTTRWFARAS